MKALTLTQPWATLVAIGAKKIETRSWRTGYRGPMAIHAGKGPAEYTTAQLDALLRTPPFAEALRRADGTSPTWAELPHGAIIAVCRLVDCQQMDLSTDNPFFGDPFFNIADEGPLTPQERAFGNYDIWRYAWMLEDVVPIEPIPFRGAQQLWEMNADICFPQGAYPDWLRTK